MAEKQQSTALAIRLHQAETIKNAVACLIPETDPDKQTIFSKNCLFYLVKNKATFSGDIIEINGAKVDVFEFLQQMYLAAKVGLSLIDGEVSFITYAGGEVVTVPDFRAEKRIAEEKGLTIDFIHGRQGDEFSIGASPIKHKFDIKERKGTFNKIDQKQVSTKNGGTYTINETTNDVIFYAAIAKVNETGEEFSYVESTENIILRANPKTQKFYKDPNAKDTMCEKFVLRQLLKRLPSNLRSIDFDKWEPSFEDAEIIEEKPAEPKAPKAKPQKLQIVKGAELWDKMTAAIKAGTVKTIAEIDKYYILDEADRPEVLAMLMDQEPATKPGDKHPSPMDLFNDEEGK